MSVLDSQNGWYEFATHACEQRRFVDKVVMPIANDKTIDSINHYKFIGDDLTEAERSENYSIDENAVNTFVQVADYYKGEGYARMHLNVLARTPDFKPPFGYLGNTEADTVAVMLHTIHDLPRLDRPFRCYRSLDRLIEREWKKTHPPYYGVYSGYEEQRLETELAYVASKYVVGSIVPIDMFTSVGMIVGGKRDSFNLDEAGVVLRITAPADYPHYCYYENGGRKKLERSEVVLAYTTDRDDLTLTHGFRVRAVYPGARIGVAGRVKTAVIDVDIEPLPTPIPLKPSTLIDNFKSIGLARTTQPAVAAIVEQYETTARTEPCVPSEAIEVPARWQLLLGPTLKRKLEPPPDEATSASPPPPSEHEVIESKRSKLATE
jgi:hypothetical protein